MVRRLSKMVDGWLTLLRQITKRPAVTRGEVSVVQPPLGSVLYKCECNCY